MPGSYYSVGPPRLGVQKILPVMEENISDLWNILSLPMKFPSCLPSSRAHSVLV